MNKILIADDDGVIAGDVAEILVGHGFECHVVYRGDKVLEKATKVRPELFILDVFMPGDNGYELCRSIRRHPLLYPVPILLLSAIGGEQEVAHGLAQGADDYIGKPFDVHELVSRAKGLIEHYVRTKEADGHSELPVRESTLKRISNKLARGEDFALCYVEVTGLGIAARQGGSEARDALTDLAGKVLRERVTALGESSESFVGHLGGGHFACLVPTRKYETYCRHAMDDFDRALKEIRARLALPRERGNGPQSGAAQIQLRIGVTTTGHRRFRSAMEMLRTSEEVRRRSPQRPADRPIFVDERH
jgi:DNA-binding response OmpR family regulator